MKNIHRILFIWFLSCVGIQHVAEAQTVTPTNRQYLYQLTALTSNWSIVSPGYPFTTAPGFRDQMSMGMITLGFDQAAHVCYSDYFKLEVDLSVTYDKMLTWYTGVSTGNAESRTLTITYDPSSGFIDVEKAILYYPQAYLLNLQIVAFRVYDVNNNLSTTYTSLGSLPVDIFLESKIDFARFYDFNNSALPSLTLNYDNTNKEILVSWVTQTFAEYIDLEWTYVNNYNPSSTNYTSSLSEPSCYFNFANNTTRVRIKPYQYPYRVPDVFDRGTLVFRARFVGRDPDNVEKTVYGSWNLDIPIDKQMRLDSVSYYSGPAKIAVGEHEPRKNWQLDITYAEEGKHKHVIGYADGTLRTRQEVTNSTIDNLHATTVAEVYYDHIGRPAVQTLPTPVEQKAIQYHSLFNKNTSGSGYSYQDFDINSGSCNMQVDPFSTLSGSGKYYSSNNGNMSGQYGEQGYVPTADGFPFSVLQYTPDNTGRIRRQGGVGPDHQLYGVHDTRYFYSVPFQAEIDKLFGTDAGYENYYKKNMVIDANGQVSVSYLDMNGRVIATALAGETPANLEELEDIVPVDISSDLLAISAQYPQGAANILSEDRMALVLNREISVSTAGIYTFDYGVTGMDYTEECLGEVCMDCVYDVEISLRDECGTELWPPEARYARIGGMVLDNECKEDDGIPANQQADFQDIAIDLPVGVYSLTKTLRVSEESINYYVEQYVAHNTCLNIPDDFFEMPDTLDCYMDCERCETELANMGDFNTYFQNYLDGLPQPGDPDYEPVDENILRDILEKRYNEKVALCSTLCRSGSIDPCEAPYRMMLADVSPNGQYGNVPQGITPGSVINIDDVFSVFNEVNLLPTRNTGQFAIGSGFVNPLSRSWKYPRFRQSDGTWVNEYRDADDQPAQVEVVPDGFGGYLPEVSDPLQVTYNSADDIYYTTPQNLLKVSDFITRFQPEWARSLLVYHPEYFHYEYCVDHAYDKVNVFGNQMTSGEYDAWLLAADRPTAATHFATGWDLGSNDPYFVTYGTTDLPMLTGITLNSHKTYQTNNYRELDGVFFDIWHFIHIMNDLSSYPGATSGFYITQMSGMTNNDLINDDDDWAQLAMNYIIMKQEIFATAQHLYALSKGSVNGCIGNQNFVYDNGSFTQTSNPCSTPYYLFYLDKEIRFPNVKYLSDQDEFENDPPTLEEVQEYADQQYYVETGNCPLARDLKNMISMLAFKEKLTAGTDLENTYFITQALATVLGTTSDYLYAPVISNNGRTLTWSMNTGCPMMLYFQPGIPGDPSHVYANFGNIVGVTDIKNVTWNGTTSYFDLEVVVINPLTLQEETYIVMGQICIDLTGCSTAFQNFCKVTPGAKQLFRLMAALNSMGELNNTTQVDLSASALYSGFLTPELVAAIGTGGSYRWVFDGSSEYQLENISNSQYLSITINSLNGLTLGDIATGVSLIRMKAPLPLSPTPGVSGNFVIDVVNPGLPNVTDYFYNTATPNASIEASVSVVGSGVFPVSECDPLKPLKCQQPENIHLEELQQVLENLISEGADPAGFANDFCIQNLQIQGGGTVDFGDYGGLESLVADLTYSTNGYSSHHFRAVLNLNGGGSVVVTGSYCKPLANCEDCDDNCRSSFTIDLPPPSNNPSEYLNAIFELSLPAYPDCIRFLPFSFTYNSAWSFDEFINQWAAAINGTFPGLSAQVVNSQIVVRFKNALMGSNCGCNMEDPVPFYVDLDIISAQPGQPDLEFEVVCCENQGHIPPPLPQNCREEIIYKQYQKEQALKTLQADYQADMLLWSATCGNTPADPMCMADLNQIQSDYATGYNDTVQLYDLQIIALEEECDLWETHTIQMVPDCSPDFVLPPVEPYQDDCAQDLLFTAQYHAQQQYEKYIEEIKLAFRQQLISHCMSALETLNVEFESREYHYTLYYYDQAGNLVRTVPPRAAAPFTSPSDLAQVALARDLGNAYVPSHAQYNTTDNQLSTEYLYNTLNQPLAQNTPDGGTSRFWYDELGRIFASQNAKQAVPMTGSTRYSYTLYDALGRIREVGEISTLYPLSGYDIFDKNERDDWYGDASFHREVTRTYYDRLPVFTTHTLQNLRNRVAAITYEDVSDGSDATYESAVFYSYDYHGNVKQVWNENQALAAVGLNTTTAHYYYDLVSGNVNGMAYNPTERDRYFHKYSYDAYNRLTSAYSWEGHEWGAQGLDMSSLLPWEQQRLPLDIISIWPWDQETRNHYYVYGPLSRTEIGENQVQGLDYLYTIQGWLKGVNGITLMQAADPGKDGHVTGPHRYFAQDAYAYQLEYFHGDYAPISGTSGWRINHSTGAEGYGRGFRPLYNGNIAGMVTHISEPIYYQRHLMGTEYTYDQLNRLKATRPYFQANATLTEWDDESLSGIYQCDYTYDPNGNIMELLRNGSTIANIQMDRLTYHYSAINNRLEYVSDAAPNAYADDIHDQSPGNYDYDEIGNLVKDDEEGISQIDWTVYGKVKKVTRSTTSPTIADLEFTYSPAGHRIIKKAIYSDREEYTFYTHDASGNILAVYEALDALTDLTLKESMIYGSNRAGMKKRHVPMYGSLTVPANKRNIGEVTRGEKRYELMNHLGNVHSVVSDRKQRYCDDGVFETYYADIINSMSYYAFGMPLPDYQWTKSASTHLLQTDTLHFTDFENASYIIDGTGVEYYDGWHDQPSFSDVVVPFVGTKRLRVTSNSCTHGTIQDFAVSATETYTIRYDVDLGTSSKVNLLLWEYDGSTWNYVGVISSATTTGTYSVSRTMAATTTHMRLQFRWDEGFPCPTSNYYFFVDNILITRPVSSVVTHNFGDYRFGFNGMEKTDEWQGGGMEYDFGARMYDPRVGRWMAVDPLGTKMPDWSPYSAMFDNPLKYIDENGEIPINPLPFLLARVAAKFSGSVAYFSGTIGINVGVTEQGAGFAYQQMFAADPHGNYAFVGSIAGFLDILGVKTSNSGKAGATSDGSWFMGLSVGVSGDMGFYNFSNVQLIAGMAKQLNIGGKPAPLGVSINMKDNNAITGGQISGGVAAGGGFGVLDQTAYVVAFTLRDFTNAGIAVGAATWNFVKASINPDYTNVSMDLSYANKDNKISIGILITGENSKGEKVIISSHQVITFSINKQNTLLKTSTVSDAGIED